MIENIIIDSYIPITMEAQLKEWKEFAVSINHETRTLISTILNTVGTLRIVFEKCRESKCPLNYYHNKITELIDVNTREVLKLREILEYFSKQAKEKATNDRIPINLHEHIGETILTKKNTFVGADNIKMVVKTETSKNTYVMGIRYQIDNIFGNIIENAMKACMENTDNKIQEILIEILYSDDKKDVIVKISDTGIGIPKEEVNNVFDRGYGFFKYGDKIGLSIVKEFCKMNLIDISIQTYNKKKYKSIYTTTFILVFKGGYEEWIQ